LVGFECSLPSGIATTQGRTSVDNLTAGDGVLPGKVAWFPSKKLAPLFTLRKNLTTYLRGKGFVYNDSFVINVKHKDEVKAYLQAELDRAEAIANDLVVDFYDICQKYWDDVEAKDAAKASLLRAFAGDLPTFQAAFDISLLPMLSFAAEAEEDKAVLEDNLTKAIYKNVAVIASLELKKFFGTDGRIKQKITSIEGCKDLLVALQDLAISEPELAVAVDTFRSVLAALPKKNLQSSEVSTLAAWVAILTNPAALKDHTSGIKQFDLSGFVLQPAQKVNAKTGNGSAKKSNVKKAKPKFTPQLGFLDF
jgi:hypothetical protein